MIRYVVGQQGIPVRFWTISTEQQIPGSQHLRPEVELNCAEQERYLKLVEDGCVEPCMGDVLDRFIKKEGEH